MEYRLIHDYIPFIEDIYLVSEYGDIYLKVKSYNGSYKCAVYDKEGKSTHRCVTDIVKSLEGIEFKEVEDCLVQYRYELYSKRRILPDKKLYKYFKFYKNGHEVRVKYAVHKIVDVCFNNGKLDKDTHHIDFNKLNNHYTNLVSIKHKDHLKYHKKGVNGKYLLKYDFIEFKGDINKVYENTSMRDIAKDLNISFNTLKKSIERGYFRNSKIIVKECSTTTETK